MSESMFPASDACASIMAFPALGLEAAWNVPVVRPAMVRGWNAVTPVGTRNPLSKPFLSVFPSTRPAPGQPLGQTRTEVKETKVESYLGYVPDEDLTCFYRGSIR